MSDKEIAIEVLSQLPKDASFNRIREEIDILENVRKGVVAANQGRTTPHEDVKDMIDQWTTK